MASIKKRGNKYSVVYYYEDPQTKKRKQKWESFDTKGEAYKRKVEIESELLGGNYAPPSDITVNEYFDRFVELYGTSKWGQSTFSNNVGLFRNYISPEIGDLKMVEVKKITIDTLYRNLSKTKPVEVRGKKPKPGQTLSPALIEKIAHLLGTMFKQAKLWELVKENPTIGAIRVMPSTPQRVVWTPEEIKKALDLCDDGRLYIAMNLSFACSLRLGEAVGLTWDCVHIADEEIQKDDASIYIDKTLARVGVAVTERISDRGVIKHFPTSKLNARTHLVLKKPKTSSSVRKIWLPRTVALILKAWKEKQEELKQILGDAYMDYNLVITHNDGRPVDLEVIERAFSKLKKKAELPQGATFHSLRHASATHKLYISHGNIKDVQGDTGHASADILTNVYGHILDERRKENAKLFDKTFYQNPDLRNPKGIEEEKSTMDVTQLLKMVKETPELKEMLKQIINE